MEEDEDDDCEDECEDCEESEFNVEIGHRC